MFYQKIKRNVQCTLCPHMCILHEGNIGLCGVRQNLGGHIKCRVHGMVSGYAFDPIEKKPLYHFYPGKKILSVGSFGCNLKCNFCQNWEISVASRTEKLYGELKTVSPIIENALLEPDNIGIAYTYNEPTVWFEFMYKVATEAKKCGLKNVMVSNGYINAEPLKKLFDVIDAFNIDLKGFTNSFYHEMTGGRLKPVLESLKLISKHKKHLEITNLVIPGKNDDMELFKEMVYWIESELSADTVLHISRYFPKYKQALPPTPESTLIEMAKIANEKLNFVYLGNMRSLKYSTTYCPNCQSELIMRTGYPVKFTSNYKGANCLKCNSELPIIC